MDYQPKHCLTRLFEAAVTIAVSAYLIRLAVLYIASVKWQLCAIAGIAVLAAVGYRLYRWRRRSRGWRDEDENF